MTTAKEFKVSENSVVILGSLAIFGVVMVIVIALVYNRQVSLRATQESLEIQTKGPEQTEGLPEVQTAKVPNTTSSR